MEAAHAELLRRSLTYLEQSLQTEDVLAGLLEDGVFSSAESEACLAPDAPQYRRRALVELLMTKTNAGYRSFCAILDRVQPDVKEMLDRTADGEGATSLIYCNKHQLEEAHRRELQRKNEEIAELKKKVANLEELIQALTLNVEQPLVVVEEQAANISDDQNVKYGGCALSMSPGCDVSQLVLLPCLHAVCVPCIVQHDTQEVTCEDHEDKQEVTSEDNDDKEEVKSEDNDDTDKVKSEDNDDTEKVTCGDHEDKQEVTCGNHEDKQEVTCGNHEDTQEVTCEDQEEVTSEDNDDREEVAWLGNDDTEEVKSEDNDDTEEVKSEDNDDTEKLTCIDNKERQQITCACGQKVNRSECLLRDFVRRNELGYENYLSKGQVCTYCESNEASSVCTNCNAHLCSECRPNHDRIKMHKNHVIQTLGNKIPIEKWLKDPPCKDHPSQPADLYDMECKRPICTVCVYEGHEHDSNISLKIAADKAKATMNSLIESETRKMPDIEDRLSAVARHQEELMTHQNDLRRTVIELRKDLATGILHRQNQLHDEITQCIAVCMESAQKQKNHLESAAASTTSIVNYINRALKSTTQAELVAISQAIQRKVEEDQAIEIPPDDTRGTRIRVSIQGQRVLHKFIDTFGCLYTTMTDEELGDTQAILQENHYLKEKLEAMKQNQSKEYSDLTAALADVKICVTSLHQPLKLLSYPHMTFSTSKANTNICHVSADGILLNIQDIKSRTSHRNSMKSMKLTYYQGTFGSYFLNTSLSILPDIPQYFEVHICVEGWGKCGKPILEVGVCYENNCTFNRWVYDQTDSWVVAIVYCYKHHAYCVTPYMNGHMGECFPISSLPSDSVTKLHYGMVVDMWNDRVAVIDIIQKRLVFNCSANFDEDWNYALMFGVCETSDGFSVKMQLISGNDIDMTETKKALIHKVLSTNT